MTVIRSKVNDPVIPVEGAEKRNAEFSGDRINIFIFEFGDSLRLTEFSIALSPVDDSDSVVLIERIICRDIIHIPFKRVRHTRDFIPFPHIARYIKSLNRRDSLRRCRAGGKQHEQTGRYGSENEFHKSLLDLIVLEAYATIAHDPPPLQIKYCGFRKSQISGQQDRRPDLKNMLMHSSVSKPSSGGIRAFNPSGIKEKIRIVSPEMRFWGERVPHFRSCRPG